MFRRGKTGIPKQISVPPVPNPNPDYIPPMNSQQDDYCSKYRQDYDKLIELRDVQKSIRNLEERKKNLEHLFFPKLYWVVAAMVKVSERMPSYLFCRTDNIVERGHIEGALSCLMNYLDEKNINQNSFDVDEFCDEVKAYINNTKAISAIQNELNDLYAKQTHIKKSLDIN